MRYLLILWVVAFQQQVVFGSDEASFVLKALRAERSRLESGRCTYSGTRTLVDRTAPEAGFECPVSGEIVVDSDRYRIDALGPEWVVDPTSAVAVGSANRTARSIRGVCLKSFATDGIDSAFWLSFQPVMQVAGARDAFVPSVVRSICLDPRCPTIYGSNNWAEGIPWSEALSRFEATQESKPIPWEIISKENGVWILAVKSKDENGVESEWSLAVDVDNGFVPTKYTVHTTTPSGLAFTENEVTAEWQELDGIKVPVRLSRKGFPSPFSNRDDQLVLDFQWSNINQPVDAKVFTHGTFPVTPGTGVQNVSTSEWLKAYPTIPVKKTGPMFAGRGVSWIILIAANAALIACFLAVRFLGRHGLLQSWKRYTVLLSLAAIVCVLGVAFWRNVPSQQAKNDSPELLKGVTINSWSSVKPSVVPGNRIDLGEVQAGGRVHREVLISNGEMSALTLKSVAIDCPGVRLLLPSSTIQPQETVCAFLDCRFDATLPIGDRELSIRALREDGSEGFSVFATVKILAP